MRFVCLALLSLLRPLIDMSSRRYLDNGQSVQVAVYWTFLRVHLVYDSSSLTLVTLQRNPATGQLLCSEPRFLEVLCITNHWLLQTAVSQVIHSIADPLIPSFPTSNERCEFLPIPILMLPD